MLFHPIHKKPKIIQSLSSPSPSPFWPLFYSFCPLTTLLFHFPFLFLLSIFPYLFMTLLASPFFPFCPSLVTTSLQRSLVSRSHPLGNFSLQRGRWNVNASNECCFTSKVRMGTLCIISQSGGEGVQDMSEERVGEMNSDPELRQKEWYQKERNAVP